MKRFFTKLLKTGTNVFFGVAVMLTLFQRKMLYHPSGYADSLLVNVAAEPLRYTTSAGTQVAWLQPKNGKLAERIWLVCCGNGTRALDYAGYFDAPELQNDAFVLIDYPGYGRSEGSATPATIRESVRALPAALAAHWQVSTDALKPKLRVYGQSLGCATALMAMNDLGIQRGVIIAPFTRMVDMARRTVGWPLCWVLHHHFDNDTELLKLKARGDSHVCLIHGTDDEVIPYAMGQTLAKLAPEVVTFETAEHGLHNAILNTHRAMIMKAMVSMRE